MREFDHYNGVDKHSVKNLAGTSSIKNPKERCVSIADDRSNARKLLGGRELEYRYVTTST
jgi:hypothetical protein